MSNELKQKIKTENINDNNNWRIEHHTFLLHVFLQITDFKFDAYKRTSGHTQS